MRERERAGRRRFKPALWGFIALLAAGCTGREGAAPEGQVSVETRRVEKVSEEGTIRVIGNIEADRYTTMGFLSGGRIRKVCVEQGQTVQKGQLLAELEAERDLFQIELKKSELEQELFSGSPRRADILKQELLALQEDLEKKKIFAPFSGRIVKIKAREGENFSPDNEAWLISLINREKMKALVNIQERDIPRVAEEQPVTFRFDTIPDEVFSGHVASLSPVGKVVNGYAQMETELVMEEPDPRIYPGYSFTAQITVSEARDILVLSRDGIEWRDDSVFVSLCDEAGAVTEEREIAVEPLDRNRVLVRSGLEEGDRVVLPVRAADDMGMLF